MAPFPTLRLVLTVLLFTGLSLASVLAQPGANDPTFNIGSGLEGLGSQTRVLDMKVLPDDKVLVVGNFLSYDGSPQYRIVRLLADGAPDPGFQTGAGSPTCVSGVTVLPDDRIVITGCFTTFNGSPRVRIARLLTDGTVDPSFDPGGGFDIYPEVVTHQADGKVIVGGHFGQYDTASVGGLVRIDVDGHLDTTFAPVDWTFSGSVHALVVQPDGKVLVGGSSFSTTQDAILRFLPDGSLDTTFNAGGLGLERPGAMVEVRSILLQPDGRIVLGGLFTGYNGEARTNILRLDPNGELDTTFATGATVNNWSRSLLLEPDGRIVLCGSFTAVNGIPKAGLARLESNGTLDPVLDPGSGASSIYTQPTAEGFTRLGRQQDGRIIIAGMFTAYDGVGRNHMVRVFSGCTLGGACNDGDPCTTADVFDAACVCTGTYQDTDGDGICDANDLCPGGPEPGSSCDDGDPSTASDVITASCQCEGTTCLPTQLTPTADPVISCGVEDLTFDGASTIAATEVPGANKYQFRFTNSTGEPAYTRNIAFTTRSFTLLPWHTKPMKAGRTYNVVVRASFDNGATWCPYGPSCTVKISWTPLPPAAEPRDMESVYAMEPELSLYPNPNTGDQLRILLSGTGETVTTATFDLTDLYGKRVMSTTLPMQDGELNTLIALRTDLASGLYLVILTVGDERFTERLVIQH